MRDMIFKAGETFADAGVRESCAGALVSDCRAVSPRCV